MILDPTIITQITDQNLLGLDRSTQTLIWNRLDTPGIDSSGLDRSRKGRTAKDVSYNIPETLPKTISSPEANEGTSAFH